MKNKSITCIVGTRPEAIKMAPVIRALKDEPDFHVTTLATGQHTDMLKQALSDFNITPDIDLNIMRESQSLDYIVSRVLKGVGEFLDSNRQDMILVHGDTSTTFAAALAGFHHHIPVGHVEAGLRSHDIFLPFPEEANRVLTDRIAQIFFAPTEVDAKNLIREGIDSSHVYITGNTVIDALFQILEDKKSFCEPAFMSEVRDRPMILMTAHRRESWGKPLEQICEAVKDIIKARPDVCFLIPLHKNPKVRDVITHNLQVCKKSIIFTEPLNYLEFTYAMSKSTFILSDSGGVQEEASAIDKPVLIMRTLSERPEAVEHGTGILVGTDRENIRDEALKILNVPGHLTKVLSKNIKPFGDGRAALKIREIIKNF